MVALSCHAVGFEVGDALSGIVLRNQEGSALEEGAMSDACDGFSDLPPELRQRGELTSSSGDEDMTGGWGLRRLAIVQTCSEKDF